MQIAIILILATAILSVAVSLLIDFLPDEAPSSLSYTKKPPNNNILSNYSLESAHIINQTTCINCPPKTKNVQLTTVKNGSLARKILHIRDYYQNT